MSPDSHPPAKLCPRCGAFYQDLRSQTCPQCFARLEILDDASARRLTDEQASRVRDSQVAEAKVQEDERFREQSFGACLAVFGVVFVTLVAAIIFIVVAARHSPPRQTAPVASPTAVSPDTLLPPVLSGLRRSTLRTAALLPGSSTPLYQGTYRQGVQVFAFSASGLNESQQDALHLAASLAAQQHNPPLIEQEITTEKAHYAVLGQTKEIVAQVADSLSTGSTH